MSGTIQSSKYKLHIVGPTNIGAPEKLTTKDYMYNYDTGEVYLLNQKQWFEFLWKKNVLPEFESYLMNEIQRSNSRTMYTWAIDTLGKDTITRENLGQAIRSTIIATRKVESRKNSLNDIIPQLRGGDGTIYIPGSSIKGMIHTAIVEHLIAIDHELKRNLYTALQGVLRADQNRDKSAMKKATNQANNLVKKRLECLPSNSKNTNATNSVLKGILISDAMPNMPITTEVLQKVDYTLKTGEYNSLSVWREYILPNNEFDFSITLDPSITKYIGIYSLKDLLDIIERSHNQTRNILKNVFKDIPKSVWSQGDMTNAYLGGNVGFLHKTVLMTAFDDKPEVGRDIIKAILNNQFSKHKHFKDRLISPRTIKLTEWNNELWEVGGIRIEPIE